MKRPAVSTQRRSSDETASISHNLPRALPTFRRKSDMTWYTTPPSRIVLSTVEGRACKQPLQKFHLRESVQFARMVSKLSPNPPRVQKSGHHPTKRVRACS